MGSRSASQIQSQSEILKFSTHGKVSKCEMLAQLYSGARSRLATLSGRQLTNDVVQLLCLSSAGERYPCM